MYVAPVAEYRCSERTLPDFVVLGAQKSASTYLQDQLHLHPEVHVAEGEVRAFEEPHYSRGAVAGLPAIFEEVASRQVCGIKRPDYLGRPEIPERLHRHLPEARLIAVLRDPVPRAISSYFHFVRHGFVPLAPVDDAFVALLSGAWESAYPRAHQILTYGLYGEQLQRYLEYFPPQRMLVLGQQQLIEERTASLTKAFEFLGVDSSAKIPIGPKVSNKGVYSSARLRLLRTKNRQKYHYAADLSRREERRMTPWGYVYNTAAVGLDRLILSRFDDGRAPSLRRDVRARLVEYYEEDGSVLRDLLPLWSTSAPWLGGRSG